MSGHVVVRRLAEEDWETYRTIRLEMLRESPTAYGMTYAQSAEFPETHWRRRMVDATAFLATVDGAPAGSASCYVPRDEATGALRDPELIAMWVDPRLRRLGIGQALVEAVVAHVTGQGHRRLRLSVVEHNAGAARLYERCGFTDTGEREANPNQPGVLEVRMVLDLAHEDR